MKNKKRVRDKPTNPSPADPCGKIRDILKTYGYGDFHTSSVAVALQELWGSLPKSQSVFFQLPFAAETKDKWFRLCKRYAYYITSIFHAETLQNAPTAAGQEKKDAAGCQDANLLRQDWFLVAAYYSLRYARQQRRLECKEMRDISSKYIWLGKLEIDSIDVSFKMDPLMPPQEIRFKIDELRDVLPLWTFFFPVFRFRFFNRFVKCKELGGQKAAKVGVITGMGGMDECSKPAGFIYFYENENGVFAIYRNS